MNLTKNHEVNKIKCPKFGEILKRKKAPASENKINNHVRKLFKKELAPILAAVDKPNPEAQETTEVIIFDNKIKTNHHKAPAVSIITDENLLFTFLIVNKPGFTAAELWEILEAHLELYLVEIFKLNITPAPYL